jgi:hypothetical protein
LLEHYLAYEDQLQAIAAGHRAVQACGFDRLWQQALTMLQSMWQQVQQRSQERQGRDNRPSQMARLWVGLRARDEGDALLLQGAT